MTTSEESKTRKVRERVMLVVGPFLKRLILPVGAIIMALLVGAIFILAIGKNPISAYAALLQGAFGDVFSIGETLENTTPLILTGLAVAFAFRAKLFNIGGEGQFLMGALAATWVGTNLALPTVIHLPLTLLAGIIVGGLWGGIAGFLKATRGVLMVRSGKGDRDRTTVLPQALRRRSRCAPQKDQGVTRRGPGPWDGRGLSVLRP